MATNFGYFKTTAGILKQISIGLVAFVVILSTVSHFTSKYTTNRAEYAHLFTKNEVRSLWREIYLMGSSILILLLSVCDIFFHSCSIENYWNKKTAIISFFYHVASALLLGSSGVLMIVSAVNIYGINCTTENGCQAFEVKLAAGALSMVSAIIFGSIAVVVLTNRKDVEREMLLSNGDLSKK